MANIKYINDLNDEALKVFMAYSENQLAHIFEPAKGLFIAESPKVIERALDAGCVPYALLMEQKHLEGEMAPLMDRFEDVPVYIGEEEVLKGITGFKLTRGALCAMYRPDPEDPVKICSGARRIAVLENVMNPTNIGAIFRSAAALHVEAILLTGGCADPLYRRALRVSMGNVFLIPWTYIEDHKTPWPEQGMKILKDMGFATAAMALSDDSVSIDDKNLAAEEKLAIILGTEGDGLGRATIADCDYTVKIPMAEGVDSLNVAAASAVAFWELTK